MEQIFNEEGKAAGRLVAANDERARFKRRISWKEGPPRLRRLSPNGRAVRAVAR
jgi:hypothetical protein